MSDKDDNNPSADAPWCFTGIATHLRALHEYVCKNEDDLSSSINETLVYIRNLEINVGDLKESLSHAKRYRREREHELEDKADNEREKFLQTIRAIKAKKNQEHDILWARYSEAADRLRLLLGPVESSFKPKPMDWLIHDPQAVRILESVTSLCEGLSSRAQALRDQGGKEDIYQADCLDDFLIEVANSAHQSGILEGD